MPDPVRNTSSFTRSLQKISGATQEIVDTKYLNRLISGGEMVGENVRVQFKSSWPVQFVQVCRLMLQWSSLSQHADLKYSLLNSGHVYFMVFILTSAHSLYDVSKGQHPPS